MTIAYATVVGEPGDVKLARWLRAYLICLAIFFMCVGFAWGISVFVIPHFEQMFKDFKMSLPPATMLILLGSHFLVLNPIAWLALLLFIVAGPVAPSFVMAWPTSEKIRRRIRRVAIFLMVLGIVMYLAVMALGLVLPLIKLRESVAGA